MLLFEVRFLTASALSLLGGLLVDLGNCFFVAIQKLRIGTFQTSLVSELFVVALLATAVLFLAG